MPRSSSSSVFAPRFTTIRNRFLSRWQSVVESIVLRQLEPEQRTRVAAMASPLMQGVIRHIQTALAGRDVDEPDDSATDRALQVQAYLSFLFFRTAMTKVLANDDGIDHIAEEEIRKYSTADYDLPTHSGWYECLTEFNKRYQEDDYAYDSHGVPRPRDLRPYVEPAGNLGVIAYTLPVNAKVALLGDWGTGMPDAKALLTRILVELKPDAIIHLGDVYYSGTREECRRNFIDVINDCFQETKTSRVPVFTIPGNHEYYSGGEGFFEIIAEINQEIPGATQNASYFCLRTADHKYQLLGMDTGRFDFDPHRLQYEMKPFTWYYGTKVSAPPLQSVEAAWHRKKIADFAGLSILFSHHQLYSASSRLNGEDTHLPGWLNTSLLETFLPYFDKIAGWFWGHEHNMAFFQNDFLGLSRGRLLGASAYEATEDEQPYQREFNQVPFLANMPKLSLSPYYYRYYDSDDGVFEQGPRYYNHSCALITFGGSEPTVDYYQYPSWGGSHVDPIPPLEPIAWPGGGRDTLAKPRRTIQQDWYMDIRSHDGNIPGTSVYDINPIVHRDFLYTGSNGLVYKIDPARKKRLYYAYVYHTGYPVHLVAYKSMLVAGSAGYVQFFDVEDLSQLTAGPRDYPPIEMKAWHSQKDAAENSVTRLLLTDVGLFAACNGIVCRIDLATGTQVDRTDLRGLKEGSNQKIEGAEVRMAYDSAKKRLLCGTYGYVVELNATRFGDTGQRKVHSLRDTGTGKISVRVLGGEIYAAGRGRLFRLGTTPGVKINDHEKEVNFMQGLDDYLIVGTAGRVMRFTKDTLSNKWDKDQNMDHTGRSIVHLQPEIGFVLAGARGYLYEFDLETGERRNALPGDPPGDPGNYQKHFGSNDTFPNSEINFALGADRIYAAGYGSILGFRYYPGG